MHNVQNAMFAAAMAFSMGVKLEDIRHGLRTFDTTFFQAPGRMNVFDEHPLQGDPRLRPQPRRGRGDVPAGRPARGQGPEARGAGGARATGATRTSREIAQRAAGTFEHYICRRDDTLRGAHRRGGAPDPAGGAPGGGGARQADHGHPRRAARGGRRAPHGARGRPPADLRRRDRADLEADHALPARRERARCARRPRSPAARVEVTTPAPGAELPDSEQLIRDERGVRLAREADD